MVTLTEKAAGELKRTMESQNCPETTVVRLAVAGGGCSGFEYRFGLDESANEETDHVYDHFGVKLVVQKNHDLHLDGTTIDYYDGIEKRGFTFTNPNVSRTCGCGSSFSM